MFKPIVTYLSMYIHDDYNEYIDPDMDDQHFIQQEHDGTQDSTFPGQFTGVELAEHRIQLGVGCVQKGSENVQT